MKRLFVSGANGFLGSNIIKKAVLAGCEVVAVTSADKAVCDVETVKTEDFLKNGYSFKPGDVFINCLFPTNADGYRMADGLKKVYRIISVCGECKVGAFVNISSQSVYNSKREQPAKEDDKLCPETPYAVGKYSTEEFCNEVLKNTAHTNIRLASLLGVGYEQRIINRMVGQAFSGAQLKVIGGMQRYGFLDVEDAAEAIVKLAVSPCEKWKDIYNLGTSESVTLLEVVDMICELMKSVAGKDVSYTVAEGMDTRNSSLDAGRFMNDFDWKPRKNVYQITKEIVLNKFEDSGS